MKLPKLPEIEDSGVEEEKPERKRPKIPKTKFDSEGNPVLAIPDLNDVELNAEIDKYFGNYEEED